MPQHRHLTADVAELITYYEEIINQYHQFYLTTQKSQNQSGNRLKTTFDLNLLQLREQAESAKWKCISKGYCDIETGWHKKKDKRLKQS